MLIALNGRLRAGKDTAALRIETMVGDQMPVRRLAFADPLKNSVCALFGITREELEQLKVMDIPTVGLIVKPRELKWTLEKGDMITMTMRRFLERYGTESHRNIFGDTFWLDQALPPDFDHSDGLYLVTDCRFPNEAERVRELDGIVVEIIGPDGRAGNGHPSDSPLPDELIDAYIMNDVRDDGYAKLSDQIGMVIAGAEVAAPEHDFNGRAR